MDTGSHLLFYLLACKAMPVIKHAKKEETFILKLIKHNGSDFKGLIQSKVC